MYRVVNHLDAPKRMLTLTVDEFLVASLGLMLFVASNHKVMVGALGLAFLGALKHVKKAVVPEFYWCLPTGIYRAL